MKTEAEARFIRSLQSLHEEVESEESVMDFLDALDVIASNLAAYKLPKSRAAKHGNLGDVLVEFFVKKKSSDSLIERASKVRRKINRLRKADYGDLDEYDLVELAEKLRDELKELLKEFL